MFRLIVAGRAIYCLELLLKGIAELISESGGSIVNVVSIDYQQGELQLGRSDRIDYPENLMVLSANGILELWPWGHDQIGICLRSPLRLLQEGRRVTEFSFSLFMRSLMRRVSSFAYYYGGGEIEADFNRLSQLASQPTMIENCFRSDASPEGQKKLAGITGHGKLEGEFHELMPFLVIGSYLNVGKGAAFGMGQYELTFI
jgi:hypothetical protein